MAGGRERTVLCEDGEQMTQLWLDFGRVYPAALNAFAYENVRGAAITTTLAGRGRATLVSP